MNRYRDRKIDIHRQRGRQTDRYLDYLIQNRQKDRQKIDRYKRQIVRQKVEYGH